MTPTAFLNLGLPETVVIGVVALLLFGPRLGRILGKAGGTLLKAKREIEGAKHGITRAVESQIDSALSTKKKPKPAARPEPPPEEDDTAADEPEADG